MKVVTVQLRLVQATSSLPILSSLHRMVIFILMMEEGIGEYGNGYQIQKLLLL
jgi:hypothetical protein